MDRRRGAGDAVDQRLIGLLLLWGCRATGDGSAPGTPEVRALDTGTAPGNHWSITAAQVSLSDSVTESGGGDSGETGDDTAVEWPGLNLNYRRVDVAGYNSCSLTDTGKIVCWGQEYTNQSDIPSGIFLEIGMAGSRICALREDGEIICFGRAIDSNYEYPPPPIGTWSRLVCGGSGCAALNEDGHMTWWYTSPDYFITYEPPEEQFIDIDVSSFSACALTSSRDIRCWYKDDPSAETMTIRLEGNFKTLSGTEDYGCGLDGDGNISCWTEFAGDAHPRGYRWKDLSITGDWNCGILQDGTPTCWGCVWGQYCGDVMSIPEVPLVQVASDMEHACGLTPDNRFVCWGWDWYGETQPPEEYR